LGIGVGGFRTGLDMINEIHELHCTTMSVKYRGEDA
jgi:hypothetical protein